MAKFVTLTAVNGDVLTVNVDAILFMLRHDDPADPHTALTTLLPTGAQPHVLTVKQSIDDILALAS